MECLKQASLYRLVTVIAGLSFEESIQAVATLTTSNSFAFTVDIAGIAELPFDSHLNKQFFMGLTKEYCRKDSNFMEYFVMAEE